MEIIQKIDTDILLYIQENLRNDFLNIFFKTITHLGDLGIIWIIIAFFLFLNKKYKTISAKILLALILSSSITSLILKNIIKRPRPFLVSENIKQLISASGYSFPSGHTSTSFAVAFIIYSCFPKKYGIFAIILAILISFSRIYIGVHYLTDIIFGAILGITSSELVRILFNITIKGKFQKYNQY